MLTKQAQEDIYNHFYNQGVGLALEQTKIATSLGPLKLRNEYSTPLSALAAMLTGAGAGAYGGIKGLASTPVFSKGLDVITDDSFNHLLKKMVDKADTEALKATALRDLAELGGGMSLGVAGVLGALGGGSLAHKGAKKLLNKHKPIERYLDLGVAQIPLGKARL